MKPKILIVDDEQSVLDGLRRQFMDAYAVHTALGGQAALAIIAKEGPFMVVIADMRMPQMSGLELLSKVKEVDPRAVRMMLTGNADRQTAVDAVRIGHVFHFLTKPCDQETLTRALNAGVELFELEGKIEKIKAGLKAA